MKMKKSRKAKLSKLQGMGAGQREGWEKRRGCRSSILLRINPVFLHSRNERCTVHSKAGGGTIGATDPPLACSQRPYDLVALLYFVFVSNAGFVVFWICFVSALTRFMIGMQ
jgi:hypothetical protein